MKDKEEKQLNRQDAKDAKVNTCFSICRFAADGKTIFSYFFANFAPSRFKSY